MGIGAAVGAISGVGQIVGGMSASKQAKSAARQSEAMMQQQLAMQQHGIDVAEGYYDEAFGYLSDAQGLSGDFNEYLMSLGEDYSQWAQGVYGEWENMFGDMQKNIVDYYSNLDPEKYATEMKADISQSIQKSMQQFDQMAAQTGIMTSGMKLQMQKEAAFNKAQQFAQTDLAAEDYVRQQQAGFYGAFGEPWRQQAQNLQGSSILTQGQLAGTGYGAQTNALGNLSNLYQSRAQGIGGMYGNLANVYGQQGGQYAQSATGYGSAAGNMLGSGMQTLFGGTTSGGSLGGVFGGMFGS